MLISSTHRSIANNLCFRRLREEENQRKRVTKLLPSLIEKLKVEVKQYESQHGVLLVNGHPCLLQVQANEEDHQLQKEEEKEKKKQERMSTAVSPLASKKSPRRAGRTLHPSPARSSALRSVRTPSQFSQGSRSTCGQQQSSSKSGVGKAANQQKAVLSASIKRSMAKLRQQRNDENRNRTNISY